MTDNDGRSYPVIADQHTEENVTEDGVTHYAVTVRYRVPSLPGVTTAAVNPRVRPLASSTGGCEYDGSSAFQMCLTQFFHEYGSGNSRYVAVDRYTASWSREDRQFAMNSANIHAGVSGPCDSSSGCSFLNDRQDQSIDSPVSGQTYSLYPRWAGKYVQVINGLRFQCANSSINVSRGSAHYTFSHSNVCQGQPGGF